MNRRGALFAAVGAAGCVLQLAVLHLLVYRAHVPYPLATALAVETAVLHNFVWHQRWTWRERTASADTLAGRLLRFHVGTGVVSLAGNVVLTAGLVELWHLPTLVANIGAVALTSVANFLVSDRWVFARAATACVVCVLALPHAAAAAQLQPETLAAWTRHVTRTEQSLRDGLIEPGSPAIEGHSLSVPGGAIHEWRGSVRVPRTTVARLVHALETPGLPPPAPDVIAAQVLAHEGHRRRVYMRITRSAIVTVTYDTVHEVEFARPSGSVATSRSVATSIREVDGDDHGFLWRLNSYWRYRQDGADVVVDLLSLSLSREIPALVRPLAGPLVSRVGRESVAQALSAVERFGRTLPPCEVSCGGRDGDAR